MWVHAEHAAGDLVGMGLADQARARHQRQQGGGCGGDRRCRIAQPIGIAPGAARAGNVKQILDRKCQPLERAVIGELHLLRTVPDKGAAAHFLAVDHGLTLPPMKALAPREDHRFP